MPKPQGDEYAFHTLYERSNIATNFRRAALNWADAELTARNELALIASDTRYKA